MKTSLCCLLALSLDFAVHSEVPSLGVISPKRAVFLEHPERPDFVLFRVELKPEAPPTNVVTLTVTNNLLTITNLIGVPDGPGVLGAVAVFADGEESEMALYRYDLRRNRPAKPVLRSTTILTPPEPTNSLINEIRAIRAAAHSVMPPPLPKDTSPQARFMEERYGKRRNE